MGTAFDSIVLQRINKEVPNFSAVDSRAFLIFACKEAYYHIRGRDPSVPEHDELAARGRCASFVCEALLTALETAGVEELTALMEEP